MIKAKVILDETKYSLGLHKTWRWSFYATEKEGSFITVGANKEPILTAVDKDQFKAWTNQDIIAIKRSMISFLFSAIKRFVKGILKWISFRGQSVYYQHLLAEVR